MLTQILLPLFLTVLSPDFAADGSAKVGTVDGKPVFINCTPVNEFTRVGSFKPRGSTPDELAKSSFRKASSKVRDFDALYINASGDAGTAIKFNDGKVTDMATTNSMRGKLLFVRSEPTAPYEIVQSFTFSKRAGEHLKSMPEIAMGKALRLGVDFDAVIVDGNGTGKAIRFKNP